MVSAISSSTSTHRCIYEGNSAAVQALFLLGLSFASFSMTAFAQTAADTSDAASSGLQEIIVTAQRRSENLQDVPITVTAFNEEALESRGITDLGQIAEFAPSLEIHSTNRPGGGGSAIAAYIRGVGTGDYNFPTDPAIGIYVDGVYMARSLGGLMSLADIDQIQVLNGPQGTLYGRNTLGGAILITTKDPVLSGPAEGMVEAHAGSDTRLDLIANISAPLVEDKVGYKFSLATFNSDGFGEQIDSGRNLSNEHRVIARGGLLFQMADHLALDLNLDYSGQRENPPVVATIAYFPGSPLVAPYNASVAPNLNPGLGLPAGSGISAAWISPNVYSNYSREPLRDDYDSGGVSARLTYDPSDAMQFKSISAFRDLRAGIDVEADGTPYAYFTDSTVDHDRQLSEELTVGGKVLDGQLNYLGGVFVFRETGHSFDYLELFHGLYEATGNAKFALDSITQQNLVSTSYAAFTQETYTIIPNVNLTAGARVTYDKKDYDGFIDAPQTNTVAVPDERSTPDWTSFTPKAVIDWKPMASTLLYTSYAEGYKAGGVTQPIVGLPPSSYAPERLKTTELGIKTSWLNNALTANFAGYYSDYNDVQLTSIINLPNGSIVKPTQNAGTAVIQGLEGEIDVMPLPGLRFTLLGDYTHDRFISLLPGAITALHAFVGERLPQIPDYDIHLGAEYGFQIPTGRLTIRVDSSVTGKAQMTIGDPASYQDSYTLVNGNLTYDPAWNDHMQFAFRAMNVTNKRYYVYDQTQASLNEQIVIPGAPLEWYFSARYKF